MNERSPGPSRRTHEQAVVRSSRAGRNDFLGYRVTIHPETRRNNEYYVKFSALTSASLVRQMEPTLEVEVTDGRDEEEEEEERYEVVSEPAYEVKDGGSLPEVREEDSGRLPTASMEELKSQILEALLDLFEGPDQQQEEPRATGRGSRMSGRPRPRHNRRRRRRQRRRQEPSEPSMYEVVDVDYESISDIKGPPQLDWRIIPRYDLKPWEALRQEKELFYLLTSEKSHEPSGPPKSGEPACCVCHENAATRVVVPCGHRCLCRTCALHIATNRSVLGGVMLAKRCPICQAAIGLTPRLRGMCTRDKKEWASRYFELKVKDFSEKQIQKAKSAKLQLLYQKLINANYIQTRTDRKLEGLAQNIIAEAQEMPARRYQNRSFLGQAAQEPSGAEFYDQAAAKNRMKEIRNKVNEELMTVRQRYPDASEYEILDILTQTNAHPMTISIQTKRIEDLGKGQPVPPICMREPEPVPCQEPMAGPSVLGDTYDDVPEMNYCRPYKKRKGPLPQGYYNQETAAGRIKDTRETIADEMRAIREKYPSATECQILSKLIEEGAHPQTIDMQQYRIKNLRSKGPSMPTQEVMQDTSLYNPGGRIRPRNILQEGGEEDESYSWRPQVPAAEIFEEPNLNHSSLPPTPPAPCAYLPKTPLYRPGGRIRPRNILQEGADEEKSYSWRPKAPAAEIFQEPTEWTGHVIPRRPTARLKPRDQRLPIIPEEPDWLEDHTRRLEAVKAMMRERGEGGEEDESNSWCPQVPAAEIFEEPMFAGPKTQACTRRPQLDFNSLSQGNISRVESAMPMSNWTMGGSSIADRSPGALERSIASHDADFIQGRYDKSISGQSETVSSPCADRTLRNQAADFTPDSVQGSIVGQPSAVSSPFADKSPRRLTADFTEDTLEKTIAGEQVAVSSPCGCGTPRSQTANFTHDSLERSIVGQQAAVSSPCACGTPRSQTANFTHDSLERSIAGQQAGVSSPCADRSPRRLTADFKQDSLERSIAGQQAGVSSPCADRSPRRLTADFKQDSLERSIAGQQAGVSSPYARGTPRCQTANFTQDSLERSIAGQQAGVSSPCADRSPRRLTADFTQEGLERSIAGQQAGVSSPYARGTPRSQTANFTQDSLERSIAGQQAEVSRPGAWGTLRNQTANFTQDSLNETDSFGLPLADSSHYDFSQDGMERATRSPGAVCNPCSTDRTAGNQTVDFTQDSLETTQENFGAPEFDSAFYNLDTSLRTPDRFNRGALGTPMFATAGRAVAVSPQPSYTPCEVKALVEEEKREVRAMHAIMSQVREPASQVQFKDMTTLVPHIFTDDIETAPEVAAAMLYSDEMGLSLKATPAKVYDMLFHGAEMDKTVIKVNAPSTHTKARVLVPMSSEGVEAALVGFQRDYQPLPDEDTDMPALSKEDNHQGTLRENLGYSLSSMGKDSQASISSEDGRFKIILQPDVPKENDLIQIRGSQPPKWFPGYYVMMGNDTAINVVDKPWSVLEKAWQQFVPQNIVSETGKVIVGS